MLPYNLHSHTFRCGHATGEDEEFVLAAIKAGFKELGFSDHVFLPGVSQPGIRGEAFELEGYIDSVLALREKYKDQIKIYLGFECEWYGPAFEGYYKSLLEKRGFDFLIMGQHCFLERNHLTWYFSLGPELGPKRYANDLIDGMQSGLFTYVAHPDIYVAWCGEWNKRAYDIAHRIAFTSKLTGIPLEINCGYRESIETIARADCLTYPSNYFWDIVGEYGCPVVIGVDAHNPLDYEKTQYAFYEEFAKKHRLNLLQENPLLKKK